MSRPCGMKAARRARWLVSDGRQLLRQVEGEREEATRYGTSEPLAVDVRNGTVGLVTAPVLTGGQGVSLNSIPLVLEVGEDLEDLEATGLNLGAGAGAGGLGIGDEVAPTLRARPGGLGVGVLVRRRRR